MILNKSQQTTINLDVQGKDGSRRTAVLASCQIRPERGFTFSVDILDESAVTAKNSAEIAAALQQYLQDEMARAAGLGVPLVAPQ